MKKIINHWNASLLFFLLLSVISHSQQATDTVPGKNKVQFKLGVFYNSNLHYYGRTDSLESSGVFAVGEVWLNKNLYLSLAPVFTINDQSGTEYAGAVAMAGYRFGKENRSAGNIYLVKPIYKENSQLVQSSLKGQLAGTGSYLNKVLNITVGGDIKLSDRIDFGLTAGVDHVFRIQLTGSSILVIDPAAYINAGTRQFTRTYNKQSSFIFFQEQVTEQVSRFNTLSYEFSIPVIYSKGKMQILVIPAYTMPRNLVTVANRPDLSERGRNILNATVGGKLTF